jgi:type IV pilus assembly protein PilA
MGPVHVAVRAITRGSTVKSIQKGFTLIELMIVVAIIAILAAIAISQYQDYVIRSQVSEGSALADGAKTAMAEFQQNNAHFPLTNKSAGLVTASSIKGLYVGSLNVGTTNGVITTFYTGTKANPHIATASLQFSAVTNVGSVEWHCKSGTLPQKWCPTSCKCL